MSESHIMLDIETLDSGPLNALILSIGSVAFHPEIWRVHRDDAFYVNVKITSQPTRSIGGDTVAWWFSQSESARRALLIEPQDLRTALDLWRGWVLRQGTHTRRLWSNGPTFDEMIMRNAFDQVGLEFPVKWSKSRDVRTIKELARVRGITLPKREGEHHNALDDAVYQAVQVCSFYKEMARR